MKRHTLYWYGILVLITVPVCSGPVSLAQLAVTTATLSGTVTDSTTALVPQASVQLASQENGIKRALVTDASGHYSFTQLPPATYTLVVHAKGFKEYRQNGIVLDASKSATQNIALTVGSEAQEVVVTSQASLLRSGECEHRG